MGKDKHGKFIPSKGKPSGNGKEGLGLAKTVDPERLEQDLEMTDKYTLGPDELSPGLHVRHPNRNTARKAAQHVNANNVSVADNAPDRFNTGTSSTQPVEINGHIDKDIFKLLSTFSSDCCVTIYMPAHASGIDVNAGADHTALKQLLRQAESRLKEKNMDAARITLLLEPAYELLKDDDFWHNQQQGLACFLSEGFFTYARLPITVKEEVYINNSFLETPLLPIIMSNEAFYLLVFSQRQAKLYLADAFGIKPVPVDDMPNGINDVVHFEEKGDEQLSRMSGEGANYHGMNSNPDHKKDIALYLEEVDKTLRPVLADKHAPLMLAAVDYLIPIYKKHTHYPHIADACLTGNFDRENLTAIYKQAKEKMQSYFDERRKTALKKYYDQSGGARTASIPDDVIPAAYYGQVESLFVQKDAHLWGSFDTESSKVTIHENEEGEDECLLNNAIVQTILHNGEVFLLDKEKMPVGSSLAASLRYA